MFSMSLKVLKCFLILVCIGLGLFIGYTIYDYASEKQLMIESKKEELQKTTKTAAMEIDKALQLVRNYIDSIAFDLGNETISHKEASEKLKKYIMSSPLYYSGTITYVPFKFSPKRRLYSEFYISEADKIRTVMLDESYDYTQGHEWYIQPLKNGAHWSEPYFDEAVKEIMVTWSRAFYEANGEAKGVVTLDISLGKLNLLVKKMDLGPSGFGALVSKQGKYISHPNVSYIAGKKTICDIGREKKDSSRIIWCETHNEKPSGTMDHISATTGLLSWFIYEAIPETGWSLHNTFIKKDLNLDYNSFRHTELKIVVLIVVLSILLAVLWVLHFKFSLKSIYAASLWISAALFVSITYSWYISLNYNPNKTGNGISVFNENTSQAALQKLTQKKGNWKNQSLTPVYIGLEINSLAFKNNNTITAYGTVWSKIPIDYSLKDSVKIMFPGGELYYMKIDRSFSTSSHLVKSWFFKVDLPQLVDNSKYPLDYERIKIELRPHSTSGPIAFLPDFDSYMITTPTSLPGINEGIRLKGWKILDSFFSLDSISPSINIDEDGMQSGHLTPILNYNFTINRLFMDVFISNLTPLILVFFLLFIGIIISNIDEIYINRFKSDMTKTLSFSTGLLFIVVFGHIRARTIVNADSLFLLEYFYLAAYMAFFYVVLNVILFSAKVDRFFILYQNNSIYKALFWPLILGFMFVVSIGTFY